MNEKGYLIDELPSSNYVSFAKTVSSDFKLIFFFKVESETYLEFSKNQQMKEMKSRLEYYSKSSPTIMHGNSKGGLLEKMMLEAKIKSEKKQIEDEERCNDTAIIHEFYAYLVKNDSTLVVKGITFENIVILVVLTIQGAIRRNILQRKRRSSTGSDGIQQEEKEGLLRTSLLISEFSKRSEV